MQILWINIIMDGPPAQRFVCGHYFKGRNFREKKLSRFAKVISPKNSAKADSGKSLFVKKKYEKQYIREIFQVFGLKLEGLMKGIKI